MAKCKEYVWHGYLSDNVCTRNAKKDGYCTQHHPDAVAARDKQSEERYRKKLAESPLGLLKVARVRIIELEKENADLTANLKESEANHKQLLKEFQQGH